MKLKTIALLSLQYMPQISSYVSELLPSAIEILLTT